MSAFTKLNFLDLENFAAKYDNGVDIRFGRSKLDSEHLGVSLVRYEPGTHNSSGHRHKVQEEAYVVVAGSGRIKLDDEIVEVGQWDVVRVAPATTRGFEAGPDGLELIAIGSDRPTDGDGELVSDWWPA